MLLDMRYSCPNHAPERLYVREDISHTQMHILPDMYIWILAQSLCDQITHVTVIIVQYFIKFSNS